MTLEEIQKFVNINFKNMTIKERRKWFKTHQIEIFKIIDKAFLDAGLEPESKPLLTMDEFIERVKNDRNN